MFISRFHRVPPPFVVPQAEGLAWLAAAHSRSAPEISAEKFSKLLNRFGCGPEQIATRATFVRDFTHQDWSAMQIFGAPTSVDQRMAFFKEVLLPPLRQMYAEGLGCAHWIHVSCTGYTAPSVVQSLISEMGSSIESLHAYHMGCYAAIPALRMARGNLDCEILHTELCTLHLNPTVHEPEQLVVQSLFADGVIAYRVTRAPPEQGFAIVDLREIVAPNSQRHMTWEIGSAGFAMTLAREVPSLVEQAVPRLVQGWTSPGAVYAIHPGGPRIIDAVQKALGLSDEQVFFSREILRQHGNMSSATLPHVWQRLLTEIPAGTPVISMAFGPGLTLAGSLMTKVGSL